MKTAIGQRANHSVTRQEIGDKTFHTLSTFLEVPRDESERSIPEQFEAIVAQFSNRLAVKMAARSLTYAELNRTANQIAHTILARLGPASEPIALLFQPGIDIIAAIFGVLKAGKFYVALDHAFPQQRMSFIVRDCGPRMILTDRQSRAQTETFLDGSCDVLVIDEIAESIACENPGLAISLNDPASLRFTSGSTGEPKGVIRSHVSSARVSKLVRLFPQDRVSLVHSLSFGSGSNDLWASLLNGASLFPFNLKRNGVERLAQWLHQEKITVCHLPPALFRQLAEVIVDQQELSCLRLLRLSGAPITRLDFDLYNKHFGSQTHMGIHMGATEIGSIGAAVVNHSFRYPEQGTPVGYPAPGNTILILDDSGREVGPQQVGEIAVKGRGLSVRVWNRRQLTEARCLADPNDADERIYLTGDLGMKDDDGFLIHMGRKDFMVKIRGYRVELAEIEGTLLLNPGVRDAAVMTWEGPGEEKYLTAYIVPRQNPSPTITDLNRFVKARLPDYMTPSAYQFLESLPLTNGKLNRAALPKPDHARSDLGHPFSPPRNSLEQDLVQIWEQVLVVRPVGVHDNFFDLGGHSLAATKVVSEVIKHFRLELPLRSLFDAPTIAQMAVVINQYLEKTIRQSELERILTDLEALTEEDAKRVLSTIMDREAS